MEFIYGQGEAYFKDGVVIRGFEIVFRGKMKAFSNLPNHWVMQNSKTKVIGLDMKQKDVVLDTIFSYSGQIVISEVRVVDTENAYYALPITLVSEDGFATSSTKFDEHTTKVEDLGSKHNYSIKGDTDVITNNLMSLSGEFYTQDGNPYSGPYHSHGNGHTMSGAKHDKDSVDIFKKDNKGVLVDFRKPVAINRVKKKSTIIAKETRKESGIGY